MKKKLAMALALILLAGVFMMACSQSNEKVIIGTWEFEALEGSEYLSELSMEFDKEGKMVMNVAGMTEEGTYELDGSDLNITIYGDTDKLEFDGKKITWDYDGEVLTMVKK